jgi:hypothetical protein
MVELEFMVLGTIIFYHQWLQCMAMKLMMVEVIKHHSHSNHHRLHNPNHNHCQSDKVQCMMESPKQSHNHEIMTLVYRSRVLT